MRYGFSTLFGVCMCSFLFVYLCTIQAVSIQGTELGWNAEPLANRSIPISCTFVHPMEGPIPNPVNCSEFYVCRSADNTSYTVPELSVCPRGFNNNTFL
ncbi:hypothetical protein Ocin01_08701 [Orchesella cincta]|uniref:Chitin-binding type-2 domain-containing protein n=1 Tax=Orchesella cincta TaxID=48709 RepID=A0A1D2MY95_ORCCI|nr:hypothetical protein Ocin01_08701 [Orchesella cincta]